MLVPVYNGEAFLAECLESILAQDFADMEILIADDASTDGSVALVERYATRDSRIRWWRNPDNLGLAGNWNGCLRAAKGQYIKYVHQDDKLVSPLAIRKMVEVLDNHPEVSLVSSMSQVLDECSRVIELRKYFESGVMDGRRVIVRCLERLSNMIGEPSVVMFRREQAVRGYNEHLRQLLDLDLWFHLLEQGQFAYVAEPLCAFRRHAAQQSEINCQSGETADEDLTLLACYYAKPWLRGIMTRQTMFAQIYPLRKRRGTRARTAHAKLKQTFGIGWYVMFWLWWKISRPFQKFCKRVSRLVAQLKIEQTWNEVFQRHGHGGVSCAGDASAEDDPNPDKLTSLTGGDVSSHKRFSGRPDRLKVSPHTETGRVHGPKWLKWIGHLADKPNIVGMELGTFRGDSAEWMLENIFTHPTAAYYCVDTFEGLVKHRIAGLGLATMESETRKRLSLFPQVNIIKGYSNAVLRSFDRRLDFCYVDAAHDSMNVLRDAVLAFDLLKTGGVMIFDDYEWLTMPDLLDNPKPAIDAFLHCYSKHIEVLQPRGWQIAVKKK